MVGATEDDVASLCRRYRIDCLYVFGSRIREISQKVLGFPSPPGTGAGGSDVDIGVLPEEGVRLDVREKVRLIAELEGLLEVGRVDLIVLPEASADLAFEVIQGECLFDADPDRSAEYELYVMRRAGDLAPYLRERVRGVLTEQASG
jgi:predicted nucleotidyltransferase